MRCITGRGYYLCQRKTDKAPPPRQRIEEERMEFTNPIAKDLDKLLSQRAEDFGKLSANWKSLKSYVKPFIDASQDEKLINAMAEIEAEITTLPISEVILLSLMLGHQTIQQLISDPIRLALEKMSPKEKAEFLSARESLLKQMESEGEND